MTTIYHNPRCTKSRQALQLLENKSADIQVVEYLKNPLTAAQIRELLDQLGIPAKELIRKTEKIFKENFKGKDLSEEEWIQAMVEYPKLIERPVVVRNQQAVIGRPPENVEKLF